MQVMTHTKIRTVVLQLYHVVAPPAPAAAARVLAAAAGGATHSTQYCTISYSTVERST